MKVAKISWFLMFLLLLPSLLAVNEVFDSFIETAQEITGTLGIQESPLATLVRVALICLVAFLLTELLSHVGLSKKTAGIISTVLAIISIIVLPSSLLIGIASAYATLFSFILMGFPIAVLFYVCYVIIPGTSTFSHVIRMILVLIALILEGMFLVWLS